MRRARAKWTEGMAATGFSEATEVAASWMLPPWASMPAIKIRERGGGEPGVGGHPGGGVGTAAETTREIILR